MVDSGDAVMDTSLFSKSKILHVLPKPTVVSEEACGEQYTFDCNVL